MSMPFSEKHYPKAPITEAVIDLRVQLSPKVSVDDLEKVQNGDEVAYPFSKRLNFAVGQMQLGTEVSASASMQHTGYLFQSADGKQSHQARINGFTMSRLAPYPHWDEFRNEARRLWNSYRLIAEPFKVERVAVRYINRIDIPLPLIDFGDYLRTVPQVSPDLPQGLLGYFMQVAMPLDDIKSQVLINETIIEPASPNVVSIVLDIDIYRTDDLPSDEDNIWALIEQLRNAKNRVFEACITDKARELFK